MDLDLTIGELLLSAYAHDRASHTVEIADGADSYRVTFRLPNGADQEAVAGMADRSPGKAEEFLLRRCVEQVSTPEQESLPGLPPVVLRELPARMAELDPQAEITFKLTCPECGIEFATSFDAADFIARELAVSERDFYRQIHALCWHYHWSEEAVLALSRRKRQLYLELLSDDLSGTGGGS